MAAAIPLLGDQQSSATFAEAHLWRGTGLERRHGNKPTTDNICEQFHQYCIASDDQLFVKARSGDRQAFEELCKRHSPSVRRRILGIVKNREDADDALQETLLRAYLHLDTFRHTCKFSTWITSIGINAALMTLRKRKTRKELQTEVLGDERGEPRAEAYADPSPDPEGLHARRQMVLAVRREVQRLRPTLRMVIQHYYGAECSLEESAKALGVSLSTAKARLLRGKQKLRVHLRKCGFSDSKI